MAASGRGRNTSLAITALCSVQFVDVLGVTVVVTAPGPDRCPVMTTVRIAHVEPWPGRRGLHGHGFRIFSFLIALSLAAATGAPIQVAGQVMDQLAVPAHEDLLSQFTRDVPVPRPRRHRLARMFRSHPRPA